MSDEDGIKYDQRMRSIGERQEGAGRRDEEEEYVVSHGPDTIDNEKPFKETEPTHSSLIDNSSLVGKRGRTKENNEVERSLRKRRCRTEGCIVLIVLIWWIVFRMIRWSRSVDRFYAGLAVRRERLW